MSPPQLTKLCNCDHIYQCTFEVAIVWALYIDSAICTYRFFNILLLTFTKVLTMYVCVCSRRKKNVVDDK